MAQMSEDAFFEAAAMGQAVLLREMIDSGIDVNARDYDRSDTALHFAAAKGQKEIIEILVANGCDVNAQNNRGQTALHALVKKRFDLLALWLIRQGAGNHQILLKIFFFFFFFFSLYFVFLLSDHNLEDDKGCSARDFALDWFQAELDEAASGVLPEGAAQAQAELEAERSVFPVLFLSFLVVHVVHYYSARQEEAAKRGTSRGTMGPGTIKAMSGGGAASSSGGQQEVMKVYLRNDSYKTIVVVRVFWRAAQKSGSSDRTLQQHTDAVRYCA
jgi:hypothetical protein